MARRNEDVAQLLENIAKLLEVSGGDHFRIRAYTEAARNIAAISEDVDDLYHASRLDDIPGVGESIAAKVAEFLTTDHCAYYEDLKRHAPIQAVDLLEVPGVGPVRAKLLSQRLGISTVAELERAAQEHRLRGLPGIGDVLEERLAREAGRVAERTRRMLLGVALPAAEEIAQQLRSCLAVRDVTPAGSIRRMRETIGDIDLLASSDCPEQVMEAFAHLPAVKEVVAIGPTRGTALTRNDLQIDLRAVTPDEFGSALQYFTGSKDHNIALRSLAMARGWKLSEYGLFDERGQRIAGRTEEEIYAVLGLQCMPPELRENCGEIEAAQRHTLPQVVALDDIRGDLHVHTDWSDGHDTAERMVEAAIKRGYQYVALTDHSPSLHVAGGLSIERVREQRQLIAHLNDQYAPFRVLQGAEVDVLPDGTLDYPDDLLAELDVVCAAVHTAFHQTRHAMTRRILRALANPHVDILGHPTGRILLQRAEYELDLDVVVQAAANHGVALEIDGQPDRLDLDDLWARRAKDAGVLLACDSDAHSIRQLEYMRYTVATARRGWLESRHVLNALPLDQLLEHFRERQPAVATRR